jgi:hypothetical protein
MTLKNVNKQRNEPDMHQCLSIKEMRKIKTPWIPAKKERWPIQSFLDFMQLVSYKLWNQFVDGAPSQLHNVNKGPDENTDGSF